MKKGRFLTPEQYIVKRIRDLEEENMQLKREIQWNEGALENDRETKKSLRETIKFLLSFHSVETFTPATSGEPEDYINSRNIWRNTDEKNYFKMKRLIEEYTEDEMPF